MKMERDEEECSNTRCSTFLIIFRKFCGLRLIINKDAFLLRCKLGKTIINTIYRNSFGINAIINSNKICIRNNTKVY